MQRAVIVALVGLLRAGTLPAQGATSIQQELVSLANAFSDAQVKKDRAAMERITADDYSFIHSNGSVLNKTREIAETMAGDMKWTGFKQDELNVRIYGDAAVVTGRETLEGAAKGYASGARRFTEIFVKRAGRWQLVGGQSTLASDK
jgi:ketosteroid isomerase-like protein